MKKLFIILVVLLLATVVVGFLTPSDYDVSTSIVIEASPAEVHVWVGDLTKWPEWAPWHAADPTIVTTFGDKITGVGASQTWTSAEDGDGELELTRCDPATGIAYDMAFIMDGERMPASSSMDYEVVDGGTQVTWSMQGDWEGIMPPVLDGLFKLLTPTMIGGEFDAGLATLKERVEAGA